MVIDVEPGVPGGFVVAQGVTCVQCCELLGEEDYRRVAAALVGRPEVELRIYGPHDHTNLDFLAHFGHVRRLSIEMWSLSNIDGLGAIEALDEFTFGWTKTKAHSLGFLSRFPMLRTFYLEGHTKDIDVVSELVNLERLTLRSITLPSLYILAALPRLQHLEIKLGGTTNLKALASVETLRYLELWLIRGLADLSVLENMSSLEFLFLQALKNVETLPSLRDLRNLRGVRLETMKGLRDLQSVADAPALEGLAVFDMPKLTIGDFQCFVGHPTLRNFSAGLGSFKRNAVIKELIGLADYPWRSHVRSLRA